MAGVYSCRLRIIYIHHTYIDIVTKPIEEES